MRGFLINTILFVTRLTVVGHVMYFVGYMMSGVVGLVAQITSSAIADTGDSVVVVHFIYSADSRAGCARAGQSANNGANDSSDWTCKRTCSRADCYATSSAQCCAFLGVIVGVIIDSMLYVVL
jgi:hypothetical protein